MTKPCKGQTAQLPRSHCGPLDPSAFPSAALGAAAKQGRPRRLSLHEQSVLLGGDRSDGDGICVQNTGYSGSLAGLLVESGQSGFVGGIQNVNFVTYDQRVFGALGHAGAGTLR